MSQDGGNPQSSPSGFLASLKVMAVIAIAVLAGLAMLVVLDIIPMSVFGKMSTKILLVACIGLVATGAIALLARANK